MHAKPSNRFSAGSLVQANSVNGVAIFTGYNLKPGEVRVGRVRIANTGSLPASFKLVEADATSAFNDGDLKLTIQEVSDKSPAKVYQGDIGGVPHDGIDLGCFEPDEERVYHFTADLSGDAPDPELNRGAGAAYEWEAIPSPSTETGQ